MSVHRIAVVTESFFPAAGTVLDDTETRTVKHLVDRLVERGHDVLIVAPGPGLACYGGTRVVRVDARRDRGEAKVGPQVRRALESWRPDLVHVVTPGRVGRKALKQTVRLGLPAMVVQTQPVPWPEADRYRRTVLRRADGVVATSRWLQTQVTELGGRAEVWHPGVDSAAFTPAVRDHRLHDVWARDRAPRGRSRVVVGHAGPLERERDVRRLADLSTVPGCQLVVIGDGPERAWLRRRLPGARFVPRLSSGELATFMASLDVVVQPSTRESSGHVLRQAAACGVPVVAPASGGVPDVLRDRRQGLLYDPGTALGLRRALATLVGDDERRWAMGDAARSRALRRSWADAVDELVDPAA